MTTNKITQIERHVRQAMTEVAAPDLLLAHDFKHVDRVRGWALLIAENEGVDLVLVEATALLHDIGLTRIALEERGRHAQVGAELAAQYLHENGLFTPSEIEVIADAIRSHSSPEGAGPVGKVLRDADMLDALGAVGIMRAFTSKYAKPEYDPGDVKGNTWQMTMGDFEKRFARGEGIGKHILDQINFQISLYGELHTETARRIGKPLVEFMKAYVAQLDAEIDATRR